MQIGSPTLRRRSIAVLGGGLLASLALRLSTDLFGIGPLAGGLGLAIGSAVLLTPVLSSLSRQMALFSSLCGLGMLVSCAPALRIVVWLGGYGALPWCAPVYGAVAIVLAGASVRSEILRAARPWAALASAAFFGSLFLPTFWLIVLSLVAVVASALDQTRHPESSVSGRTFSTPRVLVVGIAATVGIGGWALARTALDPTPLALFALAAGGLLGVGAARTRWTSLPGALLVAGAAWVWSARLSPLLDAGRPGSALFFGALGVGAGLLLGAGRPSAREATFGLSLSAMLLPLALARIPAETSAKLARSDATVGAAGQRVETIRTSTRVAWASVGPAGASALYQSGERLLLEADGTIAAPDTRAAAAETFAGALAGCSTAGRTRARVSGDDFAGAVTALRGQGFLAIDTAAPDAALARALADSRPGIARTWLHPSVRLVALPGPALTRLGPEADAVVEIARAPWTNGRGDFPSRTAFARARATLSTGGVHVYALATGALRDEGLLATLHAFAAVYPAASLWLPPEGADTALLVGPENDTPLAWSGFERCVAADASTFRSLTLRTALDVGALALADSGWIARSPGGSEPGPGLPDTLRESAGLPLAALDTPTADPHVVFAGAPEALGERAESRALFLELLRQATHGDIRDAITQARALAASPGGDRALEPLIAPHLERARRAMARGRREGIASKAWEEAETALGTARALAPRHAATRCLEGELAGDRGQLVRAEESFSACAELDPTSLDAHDGLARARRSRGNLPGAEEALRAALAARPDVWTTSHNLGVYLLDLGRTEEAERLLRQGAALQARVTDAPATTAPYLALARLYLATGRPELALAQAVRATTEGPDPQALSLRGAARLELRQPDLAEVDFLAALQLDPEHVLARGGLGLLQASRGDYELAALSFRGVLARDPDNTVAKENLRRLGPLLRETVGP